MDEFKETDNYSIITDYDDGVVCFGTVTQNQIERYKRLPRHTVLPSDIQLSESFLDSSESNENEVENDQSTSVLDKSGKNTTIPIGDSDNDVTDTSFLVDKEETSTIKLKQSSTNDSSCVFSSPACPKFIPSEKLIDTETINRYIRMGSLSPNNTFSEDQNKSTLAEDETVSNIDVQEAELSTNTYVESETSSCRSSVSSVIEQNIISNHETSARDDNICTLKYCSQQEDEDVSYFCDSEFGDNDDYSIVADKYSITPGKQRLFDSRLAKSSTRGKSVVASAPFMDRIEETTTPPLKALNSSPKLIYDTSYEPLKNEDNFDTTSVTILSHKSPAADFNQTSSDLDLKSKNSIGDIVEELSKSTNFNNSVSINGIENCVDYNKSAIVDMKKEALYDSKVENNLHNKSTHENTYSNNKTTIDIDMPLKVVNKTLLNSSNVTEQIFDTDKSMNSMHNVEISTTNNNEKVSEAMIAEIISTNNSVVDTIFDETLSTNILSTKSISNDFDNSLNEISAVKDTSNVAKQCFDVNKSLNNIVVSSVNVDDTLKLSKLKDDSLKYSTDVEMPCSEKVNIALTNEIYETNENTSEDLLHGKRQYLEFEQATDNINHTSSDNCNTSLNKSNMSGDLTIENVSVIEQTLYSDSLIPMKDDDNLSSPDNNSFRTKLSVIIENRTLEDNCSPNMVQNEHFENPINSVLITSVSKDNINETMSNEKLNKSTDHNKMECITSEDVTKIELNEMDDKSNEDKDTTSDITLDEKLNKTEPCTLVEVESYSNIKSVEEHFPVSKDAMEISLNLNTLNKNDDQQILTKENMTNNLDLTAIECTKESENINKISINPEQNTSLNNGVQQQDSLSTDKIIEDSLVEFNKLEQMCKLEEVNKLQTFNYTPKTQKLLDFSIVQQSPTFENQMIKQKLLNFSIVGQMLNLEESSVEIDFKNSSKDSSSKNLLEISPPHVELLGDESIKTNSLNISGSSLDQTITDTNLNLSTKADKINDFKDNIEMKITEEINVITSSDKDACPILLINKPIETDDPSSSSNKTIEKINLELSKTTETSINETIGAKYQPACSSNTTLNQSIEKLDSTQCTMDPNEQLTLNSNVCAIKDFSIIQQQIVQTPLSKMNTNSTVSVQPAESVWNVSNLIEMSMVSKIETKSTDQTLVSSNNPAVSAVTSEKSISTLSDETTNTAIDTQECMISYNHEFLTDIQMNDVSLIESPEKSLVGKSVRSIESDQLQEGNKRKMDIDQEQKLEKKIKIEAEDHKTPMSKLYRFRNMFKSSEKRPIYASDAKENDFKSDKCHQKLNFSKVEENINESMSYKKPDASVKSKIPCKIGDRSMSKNCEFNNALTPLNNSIKSKKAIPRLIGTPVLSDVSNSSNRKCPASRTPFSLKK